MLSNSVKEIPAGASYEPKWDDVRSILFRDGDEVELGSRNERPMTRYFPKLVDAALTELPARCVVDGEIVIATPDGLDFEALQVRLHPAASRVRMLAAQTPAAFMAFCVRPVNDQRPGRACRDERIARLSAHVGRAKTFTRPYCLSSAECRAQISR